jgi:hypothetical protein
VYSRKSDAHTAFPRMACTELQPARRFDRQRGTVEWEPASRCHRARTAITSAHEVPGQTGLVVPVTDSRESFVHCIADLFRYPL